MAPASCGLGSLGPPKLLPCVRCATCAQDEQLIITVPFTCAVKIKSITIVGSATDTDSNASELHVFLNRDDVDFDNVESLDSTQSWELPARRVDAVDGEQLHYPTAFAKFQNVQTLVLYIPANYGAELTKILFLGFRGVSTADRRGVVHATYEARAVPTDHKPSEAVSGASMGT